MNEHDFSCEDIALKLMALLDGELEKKEINQVEKHLSICKKCQEKYNSLKKVKEITKDMKFKKLPEMYWDEYWKHIYNRIERGVSWILISISAIIILTYSLWNLVNEIIADQELNIIIKIALFLLLIGGVILFVSVFREKMMVRKVDKYRKVER